MLGSQTVKADQHKLVRAVRVQSRALVIPLLNITFFLAWQPGQEQNGSIIFVLNNQHLHMQMSFPVCFQLQSHTK